MRQGREAVEARCAIVAAAILSASVYATFSPLLSIYVIAVSALATRFWSLRILASLRYLFLPFAISAVVSLDALRLAIAFAAMISAGALIMSCDQAELAGALLYFRIPERIVSVIFIALSTVELVARDVRNVLEVQTSKMAAFKALAATLFLRSAGMTEALYSKCFSFRAPALRRKPGWRDAAILASAVPPILIVLIETFL